MTHETYMHRCFELALLGQGQVAPNPMVGAVLVWNDRIIGEGYHEQYGQAHAEVNCINSVQEADKPLIEKSILYVSLEPCAHFGKTPPCADLIIENRIPTVVIACRDSFVEVAGKGIQKLLAAGIEVITAVLEKEGLDLNRRFFTFHQQHRPYIILKWAQTADLKIARHNGSRLLISNAFTNRMVHQWRSCESSIMVGTNTALKDNPALTTRQWTGNNPVRLVIDKALKLPPQLHLLDGSVKTIVFNLMQDAEQGQLLYYKISPVGSFIYQILEALYKLQVQSVLVEGGASLLQSFLDENVWDEARVITNNELAIGEGVAAPVLANAELVSVEKMTSDSIHYYKHN